MRPGIKIFFPLFAVTILLFSCNAKTNPVYEENKETYAYSEKAKNHSPDFDALTEYSEKESDTERYSEEESSFVDSITDSSSSRYASESDKNFLSETPSYASSAKPDFSSASPELIPSSPPQQVSPDETIYIRPGREMDIIMFYDIDIGPTTNGRPENGWWPLNPSHPDQVRQDGHFRTTTPLMGLYDCADPDTAYQHAYMISALGGNVICVDFTNYSSPRGGSEHAHMIDFWSGILRNTNVLFETLSGIDSFEAPYAYPAMRLSGLSPGDTEHDFGEFRLAMDDVYEIYEKYPDSWYKLNDGTDRADKPFINIFAHSHTLELLKNSGEFEFDDPRFNIRWTNGYLASMTHTDSQGGRYFSENDPFWYFVENLQKEGSPGEYVALYKKSPGLDRVEQMIAWVSLHLGGYNWDSMNNKIGGKYTFERHIAPVYDIMPQTLMLGRWNYPMAWLSEPQEGLSLYDSSHIEPNQDTGFEIFGLVAENMYNLNNWEKLPPPSPRVISYDSNLRTVRISLEKYPLEYRISDNPEFNNSDWVYFDVSKRGIRVPENPDIEKGIYIQTRNTFGESPSRLFRR